MFSVPALPLAIILMNLSWHRLKHSSELSSYLESPGRFCAAMVVLGQKYSLFLGIVFTFITLGFGGAIWGFINFIAVVEVMMFSVLLHRNAKEWSLKHASPQVGTNTQPSAAKLITGTELALAIVPLVISIFFFVGFVSGTLK